MANKHGQTIALTMIVKDEESVILRSLQSVKGFVDYYCICDTGSTDSTVEVVEKYLSDNNLAGEVIHIPWKNFGYNRTKALEHCKDRCDYQITLDADEVFYKVVNGKITEEYPDTIDEYLDADICQIMCYFGVSQYRRTQLWKSNIGISWGGVCHEYIDKEGDPASFQDIDSIGNQPSHEGARSKDPEKYLKDAALFEEELVNNPNDSRSWFYLGQSYADAEQPEKAIPAMKKVLETSLWAEEKFMALLRLGLYYLRVDGNLSANSMYYFMKAYQDRPWRVEPLYHIITECRKSNEFHLAEPFCDKALTISYPKNDVLFIYTPAYSWELLDEISIIYYWLGRYKEAYELCLRIMDRDDLPPQQTQRLTDNLNHSRTQYYNGLETKV